MAQPISIPGGHGAPLVFNVTGGSLQNVISGFAATLHAAFETPGGLTINNLSDGTSSTNSAHAFAVHTDAVGPVVLNIISGPAVSSPASPNQYTLTTGGEFTTIDDGTATTVTGSMMGADSVFGGANFTYIAEGGLNDVAFVSGDNTYTADTVSGAGAGDTISTGSGHDTVTTGAGATTVFGGIGDAVINLDDSTTGSGTVYLGGSGHATVNANGATDVITAATAGQSIFGSATAPTGALDVVVIDNLGSVTSPASDLIVAGSAVTTVFDTVGGNTIFGGSGTLFFVGGAAAATISDTIQGGTGEVVAFGAANDSVAFGGPASGVNFAVAGAGNETLSGANDAGTFLFYGNLDTATGAAQNTTAVGGTGTNFFSTGSGTEDLVGGTSTNYFTLNEGGAGTTITIFDFASGSDSVAFGNAADSVSLNTGTVTTTDGTPTLSLTLQDGTTVNFVGISSLSGHTV